MSKLNGFWSFAWDYTKQFVKDHWKGFLTGLIGGVACGSITGCGGMSQSDRQVSTSVWAIGVPGVAILRDTRVDPDNRGDNLNEQKQTNNLHVRPSF